MNSPLNLSLSAFLNKPENGAFFSRQVRQACLLWLVVAAVSLPARSDTIELRAPKDQARADFGVSMLGITDLTGDGIPDLIIGANYADRPDFFDAGFGQAYVIDPVTGTNLVTLSAPRPQRDTQFGWNVVSLTTKTAGQVTRIAVNAPVGSVGRIHIYNVKSGGLGYKRRW